MAKDPAFLFYSSDFLTGISDLTMEERGQYITLLCIQHQKGKLCEKIIKISIGSVSEDVMKKFKKDEDGLYFNERLDLEAKKRAEHGEKQRQRALDGWKKRKATANATALPLEDENRNENEDRNKDKSKKGFNPPEFNNLKDYFFERLQSNEAAQFEAEKFKDFYSSKGWMIGKNKMKDWQAAVRNWTKGIKKEQNGETGDKFNKENTIARMERWGKAFEHLD